VTFLQKAGELKSDVTVEVVREYQHSEGGTVQDRGAQTTDATSPWRLNSLRCPKLLNFLRWSVSSVGLQHGTSIT